MLTEINYKIIGRVESSYHEKFGTPRNSGLSPSSRGKLVLFPDVIAPESLEGLSTFSHLWVVYHFHLNENKKILTKVFPPKLEGEKMGVLATRSPHHPNPIGISVVKIDKIEGLTIYVQNLDLVNGTPLLDIKPYVPNYDSISNATMGWVPEVCLVPVNFSDACKLKLSSHPHGDRLKSLITETLQQDPRPTSYKKKSDENQNYWVTLENLNIQFEWREGEFLVLAVEELLKT